MTRPGLRLGSCLMAAVWLHTPSNAAALQTDPPVNEQDSMREEIQETVEIYMISKMKRFLRLTETQERKVIPLVEDLNSSRREFNRRRRLILMRIRPLLEDETASDEELLKQVEELHAMDTRQHQKEMQARDEIRSALTPRQQAQFIVFQERFRQEIQDRVRRLQQAERPPGARRRPPPGLNRPHPRR